MFSDALCFGWLSEEDFSSLIKNDDECRSWKSLKLASYGSEKMVNLFLLGGFGR